MKEYGYAADSQDCENVAQQEFHVTVNENAKYVWDTYEIGYPEKFNRLLNTGWKIEQIIRIGDAFSEASADDHDVARIISGSEGQSATHF